MAFPAGSTVESQGSLPPLSLLPKDRFSSCLCGGEPVENCIHLCGDPEEFCLCFACHSADGEMRMSDIQNSSRLYVKGEKIIFFNF